jgi:hypothetical protein
MEWPADSAGKMPAATFGQPAATFGKPVASQEANGKARQPAATIARSAGCYNPGAAGRSAVWLARLVWDQEVESSNLSAPTCVGRPSRASGVEADVHQPAPTLHPDAAGIGGRLKQLHHAGLIRESLAVDGQHAIAGPQVAGGGR